MNEYRMLVLVLAVALLAAGCGQSSQMGGLSNVKSAQRAGAGEDPITVSGEDFPLVVTDYLKMETILEKPPVRAAVLSGTPLNIWYDLGGKSVCTSDVSANVKLIPQYRDEINGLPKVGPVYSIDMEAVIAQKPDLIIAQVGPQSTQAKQLRSMGYKVITTHVRSFDDVIATYRAFGSILNQRQLAAEKIKTLQECKDAIVSRMPAQSRSIVILYVTARTIAVKLDNSIAGDVANILGLKNIASDLPPDTIGSETTPLDIEYIVENNPDYLLVTSMISSNEEAKRVVEREFASNPAWKGVKAIEAGRVVYLPQEYFLYNAGPYYCEAIDYMARGVYPELFADEKAQK
ncbi:MAG: ABC transporter substrate-binding protein [Anaerolineae bacterium]